MSNDASKGGRRRYSFDIERAIATWRQFLIRERSVSEEDLHELEAHLRDEMNFIRRQGMSDEEVYRRALQTIGDYATVGNAYRDVFWDKQTEPENARVEIRWQLDLIANYLKVAWREIVYHKTFSAIRVLSLTLGIAAYLLNMLFVQTELSYDRFHEKGERIYRLIRTHSPDNITGGGALTSAMLGPTFEDSFPDIEHSVRIQKAERAVSKGDTRFLEQIVLADSNLFDVFSFSLSSGDPSTALSDPQSVVLSKEIAHKYFGSSDAIGQTISIREGDEFVDHIVTGILSPIPSTSSLKIDILLPFLPDPRFVHWRTGNVYTFVLLRVNADPVAFRQKLKEIAEEVYPADIWAGRMNFVVQPFFDTHLTSGIRSEFSPAGNAENIYLLTGIALLILAISSINYTTLSLGRGSNRFKEVGIRKVLGATRNQVTSQYWAESLMLVAVALVLGLGLTAVVLPSLNEFLGRNLVPDPFLHAGSSMVFLGFFVIVMLVAGGYPSFVLSGRKPVDVFKGSSTGTGSQPVTTLLLFAQLCISIFMVIAAVFLSMQMNFVANKNLGYDAEHLIHIKSNFGDTWEGADLLERYSEALANESQVIGLAGSVVEFSESESGWQYANSVISGADTVDAFSQHVTSGFISAMGLSVRLGRDFHPDGGADIGASVIVNQALVDAFGWEDPIGKTLDAFIKFQNAEVIGVVDNFHITSLNHTVIPFALHVPARSPVWHIYARLATDNLADGVKLLEDKWTAIAPGLPFEYNFVSDEIAKQYRDERNWAAMMRYATLLALLIACIGVFGVSKLVTSQRTHEIGIRKVLGAHTNDIVWMLTSKYVVLALLASVPAVGMAYWGVSTWLANFAYRIPITGGVFAISVGVVVVLTGLTVAVQSFRTALTNPTGMIRHK